MEPYGYHEPERRPEDLGDKISGAVGSALGLVTLLAAIWLTVAHWSDVSGYLLTIGAVGVLALLTRRYVIGQLPALAFGLGVFLYSVAGIVVFVREVLL